MTKSFKEYLEEAEKKVEPKEPDLPDRWEDKSGLAALRDMQKYAAWNIRENSKLQLFVPKRRDPKVALRVSALARARHFKKTNESILSEEAPPLLHDYHDSPPGDNKPRSGFWTSSAREKAKGTYTSEWYELVKQRFPDWQTDYGYLFEIVDNPLVFNLGDRSAGDFAEWADMYDKSTTKKRTDYDLSHRSDLRMRFPWDILARHFDGTHCDAYGHDDFTYGWDVESTVWFKTKFLKYRGAVKLWTDLYDED
jgi:hypothetical protein